MLKFEQKPKPTPKTGLHPKKRMLNIWCDINDVIYGELLLKRVTINSMRYRQQLNKLEAEVINKDLLSDQIYSQHDNSRLHVANIVKEK